MNERIALAVTALTAVCSEVDALIPRINEIAMQLWGLQIWERELKRTQKP